VQANNIVLKAQRNSRKRESGSALVETALVAIFVLIPLLLGAIDFGRAFYISIEVANAARTAVQYASQSEAQLQDTTNVAAVAKTEAPDVKNACGAGVNACWVTNYPAASWGCECSNQSTPTGGTPNSTTAAACLACPHMVLYSLVTTQVTYTPMFNLFHLFPPITMNSQAKTRYALN
jgi:Flp pilus assembly protein TadG